MQSKRASLIESILNILIGFGIQFTCTLIVLPLLGVAISLNQNLAYGGVMTVVSIARSYCVRRWFNHLGLRGITDSKRLAWLLQHVSYRLGKVGLCVTFGNPDNKTFNELLDAAIVSAPTLPHDRRPSQA